MTFVPGRVLGGHDVVRGLEELDRMGSEGRRSFVGQLFGVLDEVFRQDPMGEGSSDQIKDGQGSLLTMGSLGHDGSGKGFEFEVSGDCSGGEVSHDFEGESEDVEEAETGLEEVVLDGSFGSVGLWKTEMARGTVVLGESQVG